LRIRLGNGLIPLIVLVFVLIALIYLLPGDVLRVVLGLPFVLLFPGYALTVAIFPARTDIGGLFRLALAIGLSIAVVVIFGLIHNFAPWGISLESMLGTTTVFILVCSGIAWYRQKRLPETARFTIDFTLELTWRRWSAWERGLSLAVVIFFLGVLVTAGYVLANPEPEQKFTEFYLLGEEGNARDYPRELVAGQTGEVTLGIVNHEYALTDYSIDISLDGSHIGGRGGIVLKDGERWEDKLNFLPRGPGTDRVIEFRLYKNGKADAAMVPLRLHVNISASP
jgi:uncharacterized membrane protein